LVSARINQDRIWPRPRHISYCDPSGTGPKLFSNHSIMASAEDGGPGRGAQRRGVNMSVILSFLGIVLAPLAIAPIGFGLPIKEVPRGTTPSVAGGSGWPGGWILLGLAAGGADLGRLAEAGRTRIAARPAARPAEAPDAVEPPASTTAVPPAPVVPVDARSPQTAFPRPSAEGPADEAPPRDTGAGPPWAGRGASHAAALRVHRAGGAAPRRAFDLRARRGGSTLPQRRGACSAPAAACRGRATRAEGLGGRSRRRRRRRGFEGLAPRFSVSIEAGASRI